MLTSAPALGVLHFLVSCTFKDIMRIRSSFVEGHIALLNSGVSLKIKHSVRSVMRCITKQNAIRRTRLKFV
jgi:hypothetical protein